MLTRKVNAPLRHFLVAGEPRVLSDFISAVAPEQVRVAGWIAERRQARVVAANSRPHLLQLIEELLRVVSSDAGAAAGRVRTRRPERSACRAASVIGQQAIATGFGAAAVPGTLERKIGLDEAIAGPRPCAAS